MEYRGWVTSPTTPFQPLKLRHTKVDIKVGFENPMRPKPQNPKTPKPRVLIIQIDLINILIKLL